MSVPEYKCLIQNHEIISEYDTSLTSKLFHSGKYAWFCFQEIIFESFKGAQKHYAEKQEVGPHPYWRPDLSSRDVDYNEDLRLQIEPWGHGDGAEASTAEENHL